MLNKNTTQDWHFIRKEKKNKSIQFFLLKYFSRLVISESHVDKLMGEEMKDSLRDPRDFNTWISILTFQFLASQSVSTANYIKKCTTEINTHTHTNSHTHIHLRLAFMVPVKSIYFIKPCDGGSCL